MSAVLEATPASTSAGEAQPKLPLTVLTNTEGLLTKRYWLEADGSIGRDTRAFLSVGQAEHVDVDGLWDLAARLEDLQPRQAVAYGVTGKARAAIVTRDVLHERPGAIARTRDFFAYPAGPAIMMLDHDAHHATSPASRDELHSRVVRACPELVGAPMLWRASASSCIENAATGTVLQGLRGQRLYLPISDGSDMLRAGRALYERLWLAGEGRYVIGKDGSLLDRNLIDGSVWQPERLDFAAGAKCKAPLAQRRPDPFVWGDPRGLFDSRLIMDLSAEEVEQVKEIRAQARAAAAEDAARVRAAYVEAEAAKLVQLRGVDLERARTVITEAVSRRLLFAEFVLHPHKGTPVSVGEVLDKPERWHGQRFADPIEPDYQGDARIAWVNLRSGGRPYLHSYAHGGRRFELVRQPSTLKVQDGEEPRLADDALEVMRLHGEVFDFGRRGMARVADRESVAVEPNWLRDYLGRRIAFERFDGRSKDWRRTRTPDTLVQTILARTGERGLARLVAVITAPTLRADGSVLDVPGFDADSGLLYLSDDAAPARVPQAPAVDQVVEAFAELWEPFGQFPFADALARGVMVAALLTATVRRALPTAPGFAFDAPTAGSGKTLLASCVAALAGHRPSVTPVPGDDDEARKALFASLRAGAGVVLWDNIVRPLEGGSLNAFLTAETFGDRVLGVSERDELPNRAMFLATGNNLKTSGDVFRRVLISRVDARVETPYLRSFAFDPLVWVRDRRQRLVRAALTILRGFQAHGVALAPGRLASFEAWDDLVRQAVVWLGEQAGLPVTLADPAESAMLAASEDPAKAALAAVLRAWRAAFGNRYVSAADAWARAQDDLTGDCDALRSALEIVAEGDPKFNARRLGFWLSKHRGEVANALRFADRQDSHANAKVWAVECVV